MTNSERAESGVAVERQPIVYCLVPLELAPVLHDVLRKHFRDDPAVEVVVERRAAKRRSGEDRRRREGEPPGSERRQVRAVAGRRIDERRAELVEAGQRPSLPRRARRHAERLRFVERREPSARRAEDLDTARLVARFQAGEREVFAILYERYFDRIYGYLRSALRNHHDAEDTAQQVFAKAYAALDGYERRRQPFRAWLFAIVRNCAVDELQRQQRLEPVAPEELDERRSAEQAQDEELATQILDWITDRDLQLFVERLPEAQRQILTMRHVLGLSTPEIAKSLDSNPDAIRRAESRAVDFLRKRLAAVGRKSSSGNRERAPALTYKQQARVLRVRRFQLTFRGPTG